MTYSAYVAEVLRAGIESVHPSQRAAARSLGLSAAQTHAPRRPAAGRPAGRSRRLLNDLVSLQKDAGLLSILGIRSTRCGRPRSSQAENFNYTPYVVAGLLFIAFTIPLTRLTDWVMRRNGYLPTGLKV